MGYGNMFMNNNMNMEHEILGLPLGMEGGVLDEEIRGFVMETDVVVVKQSQYRGPGQGPFDNPRANQCPSDYYKISRQIGQNKIQREWQPQEIPDALKHSCAMYMISIYFDSCTIYSILTPWVHICEFVWGCLDRF